MKTFEKYLEKMGYSWNDFDRTYEMENLIEQYADEKVKQALTIPGVEGQSESGRFYSVKEIETIKEECYKDGLEDGQME